MSIIGGRLKFKSSRLTPSLPPPPSSPPSLLLPPPPPPSQIQIDYLPKPGSGRIITSGRTIHGKETKFMLEAKLGDEILITHPTSLETERRRITALLSDRSIGISEPFSSDLVSFTQFELKKQSELKEKEGGVDQEFREKIEKLENLNKNSKKIKKEEKSLLEYREKKGMWGYRMVKEEVKGGKSKEELLDLRAKKSRDKFCWI